MSRNRVRTAATVVALISGLSVTGVAATVAAAASTSPPAAGTSATQCDSTLAYYGEVGPGNAGEQVRALQCVLNDAGYGPVAVDGWYGPETRAAMARFEGQFEGPRNAPGIVCSTIWSMLISRGITSMALHEGDRGEDVRRLQRALRSLGYSIAVDGWFGPQTRAIVTKYQAATGNIADGWVGPQTGYSLTVGQRLAR